MICRSRIFFVALLLFSSSAVAQQKYQHCNVFAPPACFGIGQGDQLTHEIPVDFALYRVKRGSGPIVDVYNGFNPPDIEADTERIQRRVLRGTEVVTANRRGAHSYTLWLQMSGRDGIAQFVVRDVDDSKLTAVSDFLGNVRKCEFRGGSVACEEAFPFLDYLRQLEREASGRR